MAVVRVVVVTAVVVVAAVAGPVVAVAAMVVVTATAAAVAFAIVAAAPEVAGAAPGNQQTKSHPMRVGFFIPCSSIRLTRDKHSRVFGNMDGSFSLDFQLNFIFELRNPFRRNIVAGGEHG